MNITMRVYVIFSKPDFRKKPFAKTIDLVEQVPGNCTHMSLGIEFDGTFMIWECRSPRPRFIKWKDWVKDNDPIWVFSKETKNQLLMLKFIQHLALEASRTTYSQSQLILILLRRLFPKVQGLGSAILNGDRQLVCTEGVMRAINMFFPLEFPPAENTYDSLGLREAYEKMLSNWVMLKAEVALGMYLALDRTER